MELSELFSRDIELGGRKNSWREVPPGKWVGTPFPSSRCKKCTFQNWWNYRIFSFQQGLGYWSRWNFCSFLCLTWHPQHRAVRLRKVSFLRKMTRELWNNIRSTRVCQTDISFIKVGHRVIRKKWWNYRSFSFQQGLWHWARWNFYSFLRF